MHVSDVEVAMAKVKVSRALGVSLVAVIEAFGELDEKGYVRPCKRHKDCWSVRR